MKPPALSKTVPTAGLERRRPVPAAEAVRVVSSVGRVEMGAWSKAASAWGVSRGAARWHRIQASACSAGTFPPQFQFLTLRLNIAPTLATMDAVNCVACP